MNSAVGNRIDLEPSDACGVGLVASLRNRPERRILEIGLTSLSNVSHRGAVGADGKTGDGAGVSTTLPHKLICRWLSELGLAHIPERVGIGMLFLPRDPAACLRALNLACDGISSMGLCVIGVRDVPVDLNQLGTQAAASCPTIKQIFVSTNQNDADEFERTLFLARRSIELTPHDEAMQPFYVASLSCRTIVYKAMVLSRNLQQFYADLRDPDFECTACVYHQRFSTNTAPQWELCQPFRMLAHNGEINTIRGNRNWMTARESSFRHARWIQHRGLINRLFNFRDSDSASLDNVVELLTISGRQAKHSLSMLIPPAWENDPRVPDEQRDFFEYHGCFCEPWDGPAAVVAMDGLSAVACLDRNGLRPLRYKTTVDGLLVVGSEDGADRIADDTVVSRGRLGPGQMLSLDLPGARLSLDHELKQGLANQQPYGQWLRERRRVFSPVVGKDCFDAESDEFRRQQIAAGLSREELEIGLLQMARNGVEPTFSMGVDTPLAVLSAQPRPLSDYFKQRFAQVTNPPIDPIREKLVMSLTTGIGPERNLLDESPEHGQVFQLLNPVLLPGELDQLIEQSQLKAVTLNCTWQADEGPGGLKRRLHALTQQAQLSVDDHATILVLSDRFVDPRHVALPMVLVVGMIHHELCKSGQRMMCSLVAETSDVRDPHQLALLFGYGCTAVYPYLAFGSLDRSHQEGKLDTDDLPTCFQRYRDALSQGILKIMSKMGISVLNSYQGAQTFETVGLGPEIVDACFKYSYANLDGIGFHDVARDCLARHRQAYSSSGDDLQLPDFGLTKPKRAGEHHVINGKVTKSLHQFVRENDADQFERFRELVQPDTVTAVRDLFQFRHADGGPLPLEQVEPIESIRQRFTTAAMSLGAISPEAHESIAIAMNQIGGKSNSGEGGEDPIRFHVRPNGEDPNSRIKQIASGRFGVSAHYLSSADELEIKMAQGAKPGEGGQLPGFKVNELIARLRNTDPGVTLISPPPHHDIYSIEDLAQLIFDLKLVNPRARVSVKLVAKTGVGGIAVGVAKAGADTVLISGHEGGTGASPLTSIKHAGIPWELGLAETHQSLVASQMRNRVVLRADGGMRTGRDIMVAALLGAEEFNFGTMALIALGCVYVKKCHLNNCPVGIATQDPKFRAKYRGKPENLVNYLNAVAADCRQWLALLGAASFDEVIGKCDLLELRRDLTNPKHRGLSLSRLLQRIAISNRVSVSTSRKYENRPDAPVSFDDRIIEQLDQNNHSSLDWSDTIQNTDRNIGTRLAGWLVERHGAAGSVDRSIQLELNGTAGQSLGAFLCPGITIRVNGQANDYVGKGMSGGEIILRWPEQDTTQQDDVIAGNTILYGATGGLFYAAGQVAERFCVRNSGAIAVVHGCGDHGCEYMTRGTAVILGKIGNNFGAGMTGGCAYVLRDQSKLESLINRASVLPHQLSPTDEQELLSILDSFLIQTGSRKARSILDNWEVYRSRFIKIIPVEAANRPQRDPDSGNQIARTTTVDSHSP